MMRKTLLCKAFVMLVLAALTTVFWAGGAYAHGFYPEQKAPRVVAQFHNWPQVADGSMPRGAVQQYRQPYPAQQGYRPVLRNSQKHDDVRDAVRRGEIQSLSVIRNSVRVRFPGRILDARLLESAGPQRPMLYDVRVLTRQGQVIEVRLNAHTGQILSVYGQ